MNMQNIITSQLFNAIEDGEILNIKEPIQIEMLDDKMDECFARVNEWTRFANKIDNKGLDFWFEKNYKYYNIKSIKKI